jgi:gas vesicle protein
VYKSVAVLGGVGLGALAMFLLDPDRGRTRRALIRDKAVGLKNDVSRELGKKSRDLKNRASGLAHEAKSLVGKRHSEEEFGSPI